ncbi:MAG: hypothetical protein K2P84_00525 [Undibacterium sp.]|nr:hypothetical protein [Undibacterium sp.]
MQTHIFHRTKLGKAEHKLASGVLTETEMAVLASIDGVMRYSELGRRFDAQEFPVFEAAIVALLAKGMIIDNQPLTQFDEKLNAPSDGGAAENEFFSSSLDPLESGAGISVDTRKQSLRELAPVDLDGVGGIDIFLEIGESKELELGGKERKRPLQKLVKDPASRLKRKRSKKSQSKSSDDWKAKWYMGLVALGVVLAVLAIFLR